MAKKKTTLTGVKLYSEEYYEELVRACCYWAKEHGFGVAKRIHTSIVEPSNPAIKMFGNTIATAKFNNGININIILHPALEIPELKNAIILNYE